MAEEHDSWLEGIGVSVGNFVEGLAQKVEATASSAVQAVESTASSAAETVKSAATSVAQAAAPVVEKMESTSGSIVEGVKGAASKVGEVASKAFEAVEDTVTDMAGAAEEFVEKALDSNPGAALNETGTGDAGGPEAPTYSHFEGTNKILADSPSEFVTKANAAMGGTGTAGHLEIDPITYNPDTDQGGRVTKVNMGTVKSKIVRPVWAGGRPIGNEAEVIKKAERLIQEHEQRHRAILVDFTTRAVAAAHGQAGAQAMKTLDKFMADMEAAQVALDAKEGKINIVAGGGRELDVTLGPI
jgi:hypothetical protein